ncbi:MAG TPA: sigma-70 family RNA polymerase sigma factor [Labilithrix sp.]|nr:sigma-70 family RNA polymerase sigma factor [Labilithrix sp.]
MKEVVLRAIAKDPVAVRTLVRTVGPIIHGRVAKALFRRRGERAQGRDVSQELEDLTQEVFLGLLENDARALRAWDPERAPLGAFVAMIADHHVSSVFRSGRRRPWSDDLDVLAEPDIADSEAKSPEARVASRQAFDTLLDRLRAGLSPKGYDVFVRLYVEEQSIETVSQALGMTPDALYAWRARLSKLARSLAIELESERTMSDFAATKRTSLVEES